LENTFNVKIGLFCLQLRRIGLLLLILHFNPCTICSQQTLSRFSVKRYGLKVNEPFHTANQIVQDSLGRVLFDNFSFDGNTFQRTNKKMEIVLCREQDGSYWQLIDHFRTIYKTAKGAYEINTKHHFDLPQVNVSVNGANKYLTTSNGIIHYRYIKDSLLHVENISVPGEVIYNSLMLDDTLFLKKERVSTYHLLSDLHQSHVFHKREPSYGNNSIFYLPNNRIALRNKNSTVLLTDDDPFHQTITAIKDKHITAYLLDQDNRLWLSIRKKGMDQIRVVSPSGSYEDIDLGIEKNTFILDLFEDPYGGIWVGTLGQGLVHIFENPIRVLDKDAGLSFNNVWSVQQQEKGDIYFSLGCGGIDVLQPGDSPKSILEKGCSFTAISDRKGRLWVALDGITMIDQYNRFSNYQKDKGLLSRTVRTLLEDTQGDIWAGTRKGIHKYVDDRFEAFVAPGVADFDRVLAMREYDAGQFIVGFDSGKIFVFDGEDFTPIPYTGVGLNTIYQDREGRIYISSDSSGLYQFKDNRIQSIDRPTLPKSIKLLQEDLLGNVWGLCENSQIFKCKKEDLFSDLDDFPVDYFGIDEGVPLLATNNNVQPNTALLEDGRIIFPNIYGAILIDPKNIAESHTNFTTELFLNKEKVDGTIQLDYGENDLTIDINTISLAAINNVDYQYEYDGLWYDVRDNKIAINNMHSGTSAIQIRGKNINGPWEDIQTLKVTVPKLYHEYSLFRLGLLLLIITIIYYIVKWKTREEKKRSRLLEEAVIKKTQELNNEKTQLSESLQQQQLLTKELNLSQASKNRMYAQISHEFKSPLQAIKSHLEKGNGYINPNDKNRIKGNINNLLSISNEIMELSKAESGKLKVNKNWYNINGVIQDQIELKKPLADEKNIAIHFNNQSEKQFIHFDLSLIQKVMSNLLSNAIKFSPNDSTIVVQSIVEVDQQVIQVTDQGQGIPSAEIENLTLAYYQASNNNADGTGIGLSLVKEILKLHDSKLKIDSRLEEGSTFSFTLTRPEKSQQQIINENINTLNIETQISKILDASRPIILAVDDSPDVLHFITDSLTPTYYVLSTLNGEEAVNLLNRIEPTAIISDYNMPIMNGIELLHHIRKIPKYEALPFLFLTGSTSEETELRSIKAGADIILQKPVQKELLVSQVDQLIHRQRTISASLKSSFAHDLLPQNIHNDDLQLMQTLETIFLDHLDNGKLKSEQIASMMNMGEKTLRNRVKKITGKTIKEYFKNFRLEKAKLLLEEGYGSMGEIAAVTGFSSLSYFSKSYKKYFSEK